MTRPSFVIGSPSEATNGDGALARGPHERARAERLRVGALGLDELVDARREPRLEHDVDATAAQVAERVRGQAGAQVREDRGTRLDEHPTQVDRTQAWVHAQRVAGERLELGERLYPRVAATDEREREELAAKVVVGKVVGGLELCEHSVPQPDRVGQRLEADGLFGEPGDGQGRRHRTGREHKGLEVQLVAHPRVIGGDRGVGVDVDRVDGAGDDVHLLEHRPQRHNGVAGLDRARRRLGEQR